MVESRYLRFEKKPSRETPTTEQAPRPSKAAERVRKPGLQRSRDAGGMGPGDLQSTLLEGHGTAPPDLDVSAIKGRRPPSTPASCRGVPRPASPSLADHSLGRRTLQLEHTAGESEGGSLSTSSRERPLSKVLEMMESQTLLFTLLALKMETGLAALETDSGQRLQAGCVQRARLEQRAQELGRRRRLGLRTRELDAALDAQLELLTPCVALAGRFREQYCRLAGALDSTRHDLAVKAVHTMGEGPQLLDALQRELETTRGLLAELGLSGREGGGRALRLLSGLRNVLDNKDCELRRACAEVLALSAEASKEAALQSQASWEDAVGPTAAQQWYFGAQDGPPGFLYPEPSGRCSS